MLYVKLRRTDKTTKALRIASSMGVPLLVADNNKAMIIEHMSRELNLPVNVLRADNMRPDGYRGRERCPIVIDDVDAVLRNLFGVEVLLATSTGEEAQFDFDELKGEKKPMASRGKKKKAIKLYRQLRRPCRYLKDENDIIECTCYQRYCGNFKGYCPIRD